MSSSSLTKGHSSSIGRWSLLVLLSALVVPVACSKDKKEDASAEKADAVASAKKPKAEKEKKDKPKTPLEVPVVEDFEERAQRRITAENLDAELTKLEEEMGVKEASAKKAPPVIAQPAPRP